MQTRGKNIIPGQTSTIIKKSHMQVINYFNFNETEHNFISHGHSHTCRL